MMICIMSITQGTSRHFTQDCGIVHSSQLRFVVSTLLPACLSLSRLNAVLLWPSCWPAEANGLQDIKTADWSNEVAPFWGEVVKSALTSEGIIGLFKAGWTTIKGAVTIRCRVTLGACVLGYAVLACWGARKGIQVV
jgi:hypothetical protein